MTKKEKLFHRMRNEAIKGYENQGNMNWNITSTWGEGETRNVLNEIKKMVTREKKHLKTDIKLNVITEEEGEKEEIILGQIEKLIQARLEILK